MLDISSEYYLFSCLSETVNLLALFITASNDCAQERISSNVGLQGKVKNKKQVTKIILPLLKICFKLTTKIYKIATFGIFPKVK